MRYCNQCHRITTGQPIYCNFCGRSYDFKLCPHRHSNPRNAEICSQCGSRELSTPQPHVPFWLSALIALLSVLPGILLLLLTVLFFFAFVNVLVHDQQLLFQAMIAGLMLSFAWYVFMHLPTFIRQFVSKLFKRSGGDGHGH